MDVALSPTASPVAPPLTDHLCAKVRVWILEFDLFRDGHSIVIDYRSAKLLLDQNAV